MVYRRRNYRRRRWRNRKKIPWYNKKYSAYQLAQKAWSAAKWAKKHLNVEYKFLDTAINVTQGSDTATLQPLTLINQGDGASNREGLSLKGVSLQIKGTIADETGNNTLCRLILFRYFDDDVSNAPVTSGNTPLILAANVQSLRSVPGSSKYQVLMDKRIPITNNATSEIVPVDFYTKINAHVKYYGSGGNSDTNGGYALWILNNYGTTGVSGCTVNLNCRLRFIDN